MENLPILTEEKDIAISREPSVVLEEAKKAARALGDVIANKKKPVIINNEQYLEFEDWMTVARFYGVTAKVVYTSPISFGDVQGFEARAVAILVKTGEEISAAEAMCLNDEPNWKSRPLFMLRSMAQTRACAKALRNVLAWVVVLAGYKATPAEEMEGVQSQKPIQQPQKKNGDTLKEASHKSIGSIQQITQKTGKKGDGSDYTLYTITAKVGDNNVAFKTFSKTMMEQAKNELNSGLMFEIGFEEGKYGNDLVSLSPVTDGAAQ